MENEVIILTLSEKWGKKCVAAYDTKAQQLVRLVSEPEHGAGIAPWYTQLINLLDIVKVKIIQNSPIQHQTENVFIDLAYGLRKVGSLASINELAFLENKKPTIFGDCKYKLNDVSNLNHSLEIIKFDEMKLFKNENGKTKASFIHNGAQHLNYSVTDSHFFVDHAPIDSGYAVISLPPSDDFTKGGNGYFKYVSAIYNLGGY